MSPRRFLPFFLTALLCANTAPGFAQPPSTPQDEIAALFQQGMTALGKHDYDRAEEVFKAAYSRAEALKDLYSMGTMLDALGNVFIDRGDIKQAISVKKQALNLLRQSGDQESLARGLMNISIAFSQAGQSEDAISAGEEAVGIWMKLKSAPATAAALLTLSGAYKRAGHFQKAITVLQQVIEIRTQANAGPASISEPHNDLGVVYLSLARYDDAHQEFALVMRLAEQAGNKEKYASALANKGITLMSQGQYDEAATTLQQSLAIREKADYPEAIANSLTNLGIVAHKMGRYDYAIFYSRRVIAIAEKLGNKGIVAREYSNIGLSFNALGQQHKAIESYLKSIALHDANGDKEGIATAAFNLSGITLKSQPAQTIELLKKVLLVAQQKGDAGWVAQTQAAMGIALSVQGKSEAALEQFLAAHKYWEQVGNPQQLGSSYNSLGAIYHALKRPLDAEKMGQAALRTYGKNPNPQLMANTLSNLAGLSIEQGQWEKAETLLKDAIINLEKVRDVVAAPSEIGALQTGLPGDAYGRYARVLMHLGKADEALVQVERGRGQGLARQAAQSRTEWRGVLPREDAGRLTEAARGLREAEDNLRSTEKQMQRLSIFADEESIRTARQEVSDATRVRDEAQQALSAVRNNLATLSRRYRTVCGLDTPTPEMFAALAKANPNTLYLTWHVGQSETLLFAFADGLAVKAFPLPLPRRELTERVDRWRDAISPTEEAGPGKDTAREQKEAKALYAALFGPLEMGKLLQKPYKRLVVIGDGPLRELPFAALVDDTGKRLVTRFPVTTGSRSAC